MARPDWPWPLILRQMYATDREPVRHNWQLTLINPAVPVLDAIYWTIAHNERARGRAKDSMSRLLNVVWQRVINNQLPINTVNGQMAIIGDKYHLPVSAYWHRICSYAFDPPNSQTKHTKQIINNQTCTMKKVNTVIWRWYTAKISYNVTHQWCKLLTEWKQKYLMSHIY